MKPKIWPNDSETLKQIADKIEIAEKKSGKSLFQSQIDYAKNMLKNIKKSDL